MKTVEKVEVVEPGEEKTPEACLIAAFQYSKGPSRKDGEGLFIRECYDRTRSNGF